MNFLDMDKTKLLEEFIETLSKTNRNFDFYINWQNIDVYKDYEVELHAMDVLIRNNDFDNVFKRLLKKMPTVILTFPYLFALAKNERDALYNGRSKLIIANENNDSSTYEEYDFCYDNLNKGLSDEEIEKYLLFFKNIGLKKLFMNLIEKSVKDYIIGTLVGLDSNGRKNRCGVSFEMACLPIINNLCSRYSLNLLTQKQFKILDEYGFNICEDLKDRKADFLIFKEDKCLNIEVNYYNSPGSKPEEIIDSYILRQSQLNKNNIEFAFITDGDKCWNKVKKGQLLKAFRHIKYIMNLNLAKRGMLEEIIRKIFL